jgi:predicted dehydrogenase
VSQPKTKICLLGAGFIADIHVESYARFVPDAEVVAVYTRNLERAKAFADKHHIPQAFDDLERAIEGSGCDVVDIGLPNFLHHRAVLAAARAGKHVILEKPIAVSLQEADEMVAACRDAGVLLCYAEELCFAPKYERARKLVDEGAVGEVYMLKQSEKHSGPHSDWFYDVDQSGGGVLMDMGCHALGWFRWMLGAAHGHTPTVKSVYATMNTVLHDRRTRGEDNSVVIVEFDLNGKTVTCVAEDSWARFGGMDDRCEIYGLGGLVYADLFQGNSALTYSKNGYGYAMEKADTTQGWSFTVFEEAFNQGYPQELAHFLDCVRTGKQPLQRGEDGRAVLEIICAAYESARTGRKVELPFAPNVKKAVDLWLEGAA